MFPFIVSGGGGKKEVGEVLGKGKSLFKGEVEIGKVVGYDGERGIGLALVNYLQEEFVGDEMRVDGPVEIVVLNPLRGQIEGYMKELREKQRKERQMEGEEEE